ncbi:hypothetical protein WG66_003428 [Moniliophthora roreri]|nr:hypothetical protein WG66_003428 [Moniliophthora roreri]
MKLLFRSIVLCLFSQLLDSIRFVRGNPRYKLAHCTALILPIFLPCNRITHIKKTKRLFRRPTLLYLQTLYQIIEPFPIPGLLGIFSIAKPLVAPIYPIERGPSYAGIYIVEATPPRLSIPILGASPPFLAR